jgi:hypothetical protein
MRGSREDRVVAFEEFARNLDGHSAPEPEIVPLMLGYLASRIAPGTLRHSTVLSPVARRYPTAQLWYGFCAGFGDIDDVEASIDERREALDLPASARRVARDLLRAEPSLAAPSCDIGFLELLALSPTGEDALDGLITTTPGTATVELAPYIWTTLTVPGRGKAEAPAQRSRERANLVMLGESLERATRAYSNLVSGVFAPEEDRQRPLFPTPRKTR